MRSHKAKKSCDKAGNDKEYADYPLISPFSRGIQKKTAGGGLFQFQLSFFRSVMNGSFYEAEGDSSASFINVDDADFQIVAYLADIARFLVVVIGHFVDVEQAGQSVFEFNDYAEFKDLNDFSVYYIIDLMIMYSGFPWVREAVFVCEGDSLFFTIEGFDLDINDLIWFENVFYFANLLPGNIGDVEQSFHAVDSDECAVWHDLLNGALQNGAVLVSFFDFVHFCISLVFQYTKNIMELCLLIANNMNASMNS